MRMMATAALVIAIMPAIWVGSVAWSTALTAGVAANELRRRVKRALG